MTDTNSPSVDASTAGVAGRASVKSAAAEARRVEISRAIRAVPGVVGAKVVTSKDAGHRLRARVAPGEDVARVRMAIAATLRERFEIDVTTRDVRVLPTEIPPIRVHTPASATDAMGAAAAHAGDSADPAAGELTGPGRSSSPWSSRVRAGLISAEVEAGAVETDVSVVLQNGVVRASQRIRVVSVDSMVWRAVADATLAALRDLTDQQLLAAVDDVWLDPGDDPFTATVVVRAITARGEVGTVGSALVAGDERHPRSEITTTTAGPAEGDSRSRIAVAVARATLAAVNRQVESMLAAARRGVR